MKIEVTSPRTVLPKTTPLSSAPLNRSQRVQTFPSHQSIHTLLPELQTQPNGRDHSLDMPRGARASLPPAKYTFSNGIPTYSPKTISHIVATMKRLRGEHKLMDSPETDKHSPWVLVEEKKVQTPNWRAMLYNDIYKRDYDEKTHIKQKYEELIKASNTKRGMAAVAQARISRFHSIDSTRKGRRRSNGGNAITSSRREKGLKPLKTPSVSPRKLQVTR
eukprot:Tbor_TRINITY_DN5208_c0_g3::TRINITY_DN5208_c0_g3_i1::g.16549::m.16549